MSFDSNSLDRLKELGRKLPKKIESIPKSKQLKQHSNASSKHPVELEQDPKQLFREIMNISPDGNIPEHLLNRLRQLELSELSNNKNIDEIQGKSVNKVSKQKQTNKSEQNDLYTIFNQFLLEEDE